MAALVEATENNAAQTRRFLGVIAGTVPIKEFFAPENLRARMAA
jgi:hypothetical protein